MVFHDLKDLASHYVTTHTPTWTETNSEIIRRHFPSLDKDGWDDAL